MRKTTCQNRQFATDAGAKLPAPNVPVLPAKSAVDFSMCGALPNHYEPATAVRAANPQNAARPHRHIRQPLATTAVVPRTNHRSNGDAKT